MIVTSRPEIKLLLSCVQPDSETKTAELFRKRPREDLNWHELIRLAEQHAVLPLLYRHLQSADPQVVPSALWRELQHCFQENARRNLAMTAELLKLLKLFTLHQIPAIPYKGPILASAIYGDVAPCGNMMIWTSSCPSKTSSKPKRCYSVRTTNPNSL